MITKEEQVLNDLKACVFKLAAVCNQLTLDDDLKDYRILEPARAIIHGTREIEVYSGRNREEREAKG